MESMNINSNIVTASKLIRRAKQIADISNSDFLNYEELTEYLNASWKNVYQTVIQYNLNVFTVEANLVGSGGVYKLPFDCYQIKSIKNPYTGIEIPRKSDSASMYGSHYEIVNDNLILGNTCGPVTITYWLKPYFLTFPNATVSTTYNKAEDKEILDVCKDAILIKDAENKYYIKSLLTDSKLDLSFIEPDKYEKIYLGNNLIVGIKESTYEVKDFYGNLVFYGDITADYFIKSDDGLIYIGVLDVDKVNILEIDNVTEVASMKFTSKPENIICIDNEFYPVEKDAMPIGIFDCRPAYTTPDKNLHLINEQFDRSKDIVEFVSIPTMGKLICTNYGFLDFSGKLYSNVPDTQLSFPNNLFLDCISYDLAIRFLCKMNADSSGVENLNRNAWNQLTASIDNGADFQVVKKVRR
jgi:hypothetical protein